MDYSKGNFKRMIDRVRSENIGRGNSGKVDLLRTQIFRGTDIMGFSRPENWVDVT
jgi:hypothetical protein